MSKSMIKKVIIISVILVLVLLFKFFGLGDYLSLDFLKQKQGCPAEYVRSSTTAYFIPLLLHLYWV